MKKLVEELHRGGWSCVVESRDGVVRTFSRRGVIDLWELLHEDGEFLKGAKIADKIVGRGAAVVMVAGGVSELYTDVISNSALDLLQENGVKVTSGEVVQSIINRTGTGACPIEVRTENLSDLGAMLTEIEKFLAEIAVANR